jgi:AsmA protein
MSGKTIKVLYVLGALAGLFAAAAIVLSLVVDVDAYKPRIEAAASEALGMDVRVHGRLRISLLHGLGVSFGDVRAVSGGTELFRAGDIRVGLKILPLLRREMVISELALLSPSVHIERAKNGSFNFETAALEQSAGSPAALRGIGRILVSKANLVFLDKKSGGKTEVREWDLSVKDLSLGSGRAGDLAGNISFSGETSARTVKVNDIEISDVRADLRGGSGRFRAAPVALTVFDGACKGVVEADVTQEEPVFNVRFDVSGLRIEKFLQEASGKKTLAGEAYLSAALTAHGSSTERRKRTLSGEVSLRGENLELYGLDLDRFLTRYEKSRDIGLADAGAFLVAGPLGTAFLKGYRIAGVYQATREEKGAIRMLVSDWNLRNGVAEAKDVALSTHGNRLALNGKLDIATERFEEVTVALLDEKGCARASQKIRGPFRDPRMEKVSTLKSLASPVLRLFEGAKSIVSGRGCEVVYSGSVAHPK